MSLQAKATPDVLAGTTLLCTRGIYRGIYTSYIRRNNHPEQEMATIVSERSGYDVSVAHVEIHVKEPGVEGGGNGVGDRNTTRRRQK
jgi:hypothetical protein